MTERIDLTRADDPRDVVHRAVACLAQGGVVGLPTETAYAVVAGALYPSAVARLGPLLADGEGPRGGRRSPPTLLLRGPGEVGDWAEVASESGRRLARRAWPGPVTLIFPTATGGLGARLDERVGAFLVADGSIALRAPSGRVLREILRLVPGPLIQVDPAIPGGRGPIDADALEGLPGLDMIVDCGPAARAGGPTLVEVGAEGWAVTRPGVVSERTLERMAATIFLFVCTGNTCRSPMAEAICKSLMARKFGCQADDLAGLGLVVLSAGVSAMDGMPAASNAVEVVRAMGGSLDDHASQRAAPDLVRQADHVIAMTADHLDLLLDRVPDVAPRARLLHASGDDIDDPVGSDLATYERTAREIENHLTRLLDGLGF